MIFESYGSLCAVYPLEKKANRLKALRIPCVIRYLGNFLTTLLHPKGCEGMRPV